MLTNVARLLGIPVARNTETASRFEGAQSAALTRLVRGGGGLQTSEDSPFEVNRDLLPRRIAWQRTELTGRAKPKSAQLCPRKLSTEVTRRPPAPGELFMESEATNEWAHADLPVLRQARQAPASPRL